MKIVRFSILTVMTNAFLLGISYLLSIKYELPLIDVMFFVGVFSTLLSVYFFSNLKHFIIYLEPYTMESVQVNFFNAGSSLFLLTVFLYAFLH